MRAYESLIRVFHTLHEHAISCSSGAGHKKSQGLAAPALLFSLDTEVAEIVDFC